MKRREENIAKMLDRTLGLFRSPSQELIDSVQERVGRRLEAESNEAPRLSQSGENSTMPARRSHWLAAAGIAAAITLAVLLPTRILRSTPAVLEDEEGSRTIQFGEIVRSEAGSGATLVLADSSRVEMRSKSVLSLEHADDGIRIRLGNGSVIVNAARQGAGRHLYVQTKDLTVSVVGTVFLVNAEQEGSRVAVIQGEVRVRQGGPIEKTLLAGEQVTSHALMTSTPVIQEISWSRSLETYVKQLPQPITPVGSTQVVAQSTIRSPGQEQPVFEVASVRPSDPDTPGGRGGGGGNVTVTTGPCKGGGTLQIDPRRFVISGATLYYLITAAYGLGSCVATTDLISGGPGWIGSDRFDVEAAIPERSPSYSREQFNNGQAPRLQMMLQNLLADRFKLALRRQTQERPIYLLESVTSDVKLTSWNEGDFYTRRYIVALPYYVQGGKASMSDLAEALRIVTGRTVLDRTGIQGEFNFALSFAPLNTGLMRRIDTNDPGLDTRPSIFTALEELGLRLQSSKGPVEVLVIDHVERPSEN